MSDNFPKRTMGLEKPGLPKAELIYEDDYVSVIWYAGDSAELLITFGDLVTLAQGNHFFAEAPVHKLRINTIGFMAKSPNWFPMTSMTKACECASSHLSKFKERIVYGASMGGYAALKYSAKLAATYVIALCPQWSLDEAEFDGFNPGWQEWFVHEMRGMGILRSDLSGRIYVFFDPLEPRDNLHAMKIHRACEGARLVWVPFVEHHVTPVLAGTDTLRMLINACRLDDIQGLRRLSRRQRRAHLLYQDKMAKRFIRNSPSSSLQYLLLQPTVMLGIPPFSATNLILLAERLARVGDKESSATCVRFASTLAQSPVEKAELLEFEARLFQTRAYLLSCYRTVLAYDISTGRCCNVPFECLVLPRLIPLRLLFKGNVANLYVRTDVADMILGILPDGQLSTRTEMPALFDRLDVGGGQFQLRCQGIFICADPNEGSLICNRPNASYWETFHLGTSARTGNG